MEEEYEEKMEALRKVLIDKLLKITEGKSSAGVKDYTDMDVIARGAKFTAKVLTGDRLPSRYSFNKWTNDPHKNDVNPHNRDQLPTSLQGARRRGEAKAVRPHHW